MGFLEDIMAANAAFLAGGGQTVDDDDFFAELRQDFGGLGGIKPDVIVKSFDAPYVPPSMPIPDLPGTIVPSGKLASPLPEGPFEEKYGFIADLGVVGKALRPVLAATDELFLEDWGKVYPYDAYPTPTPGPIPIEDIEITQSFHSGETEFIADQLRHMTFGETKDDDDFFPLALDDPFDLTDMTGMDKLPDVGVMTQQTAFPGPTSSVNRWFSGPRYTGIIAIDAWYALGALLEGHAPNVELPDSTMGAARQLLAAIQQGIIGFPGPRRGDGGQVLPTIVTLDTSGNVGKEGRPFFTYTYNSSGFVSKLKASARSRSTFRSNAGATRRRRK